jgi:glycine betaine transporter
MQTLPKRARRLASERPIAPATVNDPTLPLPQDVQLKRILVPVDFSGPSIQALRIASQLAAQSEGSILIAYVAEHVVYFDEAVTFPGQNVLEEMKQKLSDLARNEVSEVVPVYPHVLKGKPWARIVELARDHAIDLIVIGTHGRTGVSHFLLGSTAEQVVRYAPCPVLVVRDQQPKLQP